MTKRLKPEERVKKEYTQDGQRGQKMFNFRCDLENIEYLNKQPNKGRFLNELIREQRESENQN